MPQKRTAQPDPEPRSRQARRRVQQKARELAAMTDTEVYQSVQNMNAAELRTWVAELSVLTRNLLIDVTKIED